tara:strand:- start:290 stop:550 length:261 start_codon:yes stop_codon:yes gene_type:complete
MPISDKTIRDVERVSDERDARFERRKEEFKEALELIANTTNGWVWKVRIKRGDIKMTNIDSDEVYRGIDKIMEELNTSGMFDDEGY